MDAKSKWKPMLLPCTNRIAQLGNGQIIEVSIRLDSVAPKTQHCSAHPQEIPIFFKNKPIT